MSMVAYRHDFNLPWDAARQDVKRFRQWLVGCVLMVAVCGLIIPFLPLPEVEREALEQLPPQLARIVLEKPEPAAVRPPEPKKQESEPERQPEPELEKAPEPDVKLQPTVADAKEKAAVSGLLAFQDAFADMREAVDVAKLQDTGAIQQGVGDAATVDRSLLTSKYGTRSSGVNVAALSRDTGGVALSGRETTKVDVPVESSGAGNVRDRRARDARSRSIEDIRRVFDRNKGAIFAIYNRALRQDPTLQGKVVLELVIDPAGAVQAVAVVASELADEALVAKLLKRIRLFNFGAQAVGTTTISYPVHFLPT
jgi:hypothetical protein